MQAARCAMLATPYRDVPALQCFHSMTRCHYHGHDPAGPFRPMVPGRPCIHRHKSMQAAVACTNRLDAQTTLAR
jgi:hypothetical protein